VSDFAFFLGCIMPNRYPGIESATRFVMDKLGYTLHEMEGASCCPAPGVFKSFNRETWLAVAARNLVIAEEMGHDIMTVCSGCYGTLFEANHELQNNPERKERVNAILADLGLEYKGTIKVRHIGEILGYEVGPWGIGDHVVRKIDMKIAVHYGCHFLKPFKEKMIDSPENPSILENFIRELGATPVPYKDAMMCCGAGGGVRAGESDVALDMTREKLINIRAAGADAILDVCPFCHLQFDRGQVEIKRKYGEEYNIPVVHICQLLAYAMGEDDVGLDIQAVKGELRAKKEVMP